MMHRKPLLPRSHCSAKVETKDGHRLFPADEAVILDCSKRGGEEGRMRIEIKGDGEGESGCVEDSGRSKQIKIFGKGLAALAA